MVKKQEKHPNLIVHTSPEEARNNGKKGGIASGKARSAKKTFAELGRVLVDSPVSPEYIKGLKKNFPGLSNEELTNRVLMFQAQVNKAIMEGDSKAFEVVRDTIGEKPVDKKKVFGDGEDSEKVQVLYIPEEETKAYQKHIQDSIDDT